MKLAKIGALTVASLFSVAALAQAVAVKPRVEVRPGEAVTVAPKATAQTGKSMEFQMSVPSVNSSKAAQMNGETCSKADAAAKLMDGTRLNASEAEAALGAGLLVRGCKAGAEGVLNMVGKAKEVAARAVLYVKDRGVGLAKALVMSKKYVLGVDSTEAVEQNNARQLQGGECMVFSPALAI